MTCFESSFDRSVLDVSRIVLGRLVDVKLISEEAMDKYEFDLAENLVLAQMVKDIGHIDHGKCSYLFMEQAVRFCLPLR